MTGNSPGLNLVQRAMQESDGLVAQGAAASPFSLEEQGQEASSLFSRSSPAGNQDPIEAPEAGASPVQLNQARCREEGILFPGNMESETHNEFRTVKRRLLLALRDEGREPGNPDVVMVTSALPAEGKTFTALNLALTLAAERNIRVLLIEADVISPALCGYFTTAKSRQGLTDVLTGIVDNPATVIHPCVGVPNLGVMFAGKPEPRTPELMASPRMAEILGRLHAACPELLVVMDCPPVVSPEPAALATHVSHAIMVVAADQASRLQLREALDQIAACPQISMVFNKSPRWRKQGLYYQYNYGAGAAGRKETSSDLGAG